MEEQQNQNPQNPDSFVKNQFNKSKEKVKGEAKKQVKKKIAKIVAKILNNPLTWKILSIVLIVSVATTLITGFLKVLGIIAEQDINDNARKAVVRSFQLAAETTTTDENGNTVKRVVITPNTSGGKSNYKISYSNDPESLQDSKQKLVEEISESVSDFSEFEIGVLGALIDNGVKLDHYTKEEIKCLPNFIKAEAATQNLDLRPNSEKQSGKTTGDYIDNYEPEKRENLAENEVPGVILVQRTNTNGTKTTLEYKEKEGENGFDKLVRENDPNAMNYFSISEDGNLLIAKWEHVLITVDGEYPESVDESERDIPTGENGRYIIEAEPIAYSEYIAKYTMPFEFLVQLLVTTKEPSFCMELVDYVLDSKIVINIQEEETYKVTDETKNYTVYSKDEKNVSYQVNAAQQEIVKEDNYLLRYAKDDEEQSKEQRNQQNNCTNYSKTDLTVKVHTEHTIHSYAFEIVEADTWIASYKKTYTKQPSVTHPTTSNVAESKGQYEQIEPEVPQPITDQETINKDNDVKKFIYETETNYEAIISVPTITINNYTNDSGDNFKTISFAGDIEQVQFDGSIVSTMGPPMPYYEIKDDEGKGTGKYNLPKSIVITTKKVESTDKTAEIPQIKYTFSINSDETEYVLQNNIDPLVECVVSSLNIEEFEKLDLKNTIETTITEYPADPNPITEPHIYAKDKDGNFEKFLLAYDRSPGAQNQLSSIDLWLFEMMEERESTVELVDSIKYLLYIYDGVDRGVTELKLDLFESSQFATFSNGSGWWWPIGSSNVETINGVKFAKGEPVATTITSGVGPRWGKNHGGIDISNGIRGTNIIAAKSGTVISVVDGFGDGYYGSKDGGGYGNHIKIQHDDGTSSVYAHLEKGTIKVSKGDRVEQGQLLGGMGTSGSSTGIHLHFEIRDANSNKLDPEEYVDSANPRQTLASSSLRDWLWGIEGGSQYINGDTWTVFDPAGDDNTMNLAHGMVIASYNGADSWYPDIVPGKITVGQTVTAEQANKIWEKKIKGFNDAIDSACAKYGVTLAPNQKDALVSYIYRTGYGVGQNNSIVSAYASGGNAGLWNYMKQGYDKRAQYEAGTKKRVAEEYELFVKGDYNYDPNGTAKYDQYCNNPNI